MTEEELESARAFQAKVMELQLLADEDGILAAFQEINAGMTDLGAKIGKAALLEPQGVHFNIEEIRQIVVFLVAVGRFIEAVQEVL